ncbi:hypothetical protein ABW19_dt0203880 [Dactylella cylindrospora]|nr:hypothetical protein ABW19_dt0203880 [Dactylella cylindrospora]
MVSAFRYQGKPKNVVLKGGLTRLGQFSFDFIMDNIALSGDSKWMYLAGHGEPLNLHSHWETPGQISSPSVSYRMSLVELEGGFFGTKGEVGEPRVEKLVVDRSGSMGNGSTTAVGDDDRNRFWMSGLTFRGILECKLHGSKHSEDDPEE